MQRTKSYIRRPSILESLETRRLLATFTVTNVNDTGAGSLRQAIAAVAASTAADVIAFNLTTGGVNGVYTIKPTTALAAIGEFDWVDGSTQPGYAGAPRVELDGSGSGGVGLQLERGGGVRGLSIVNWGYAGIVATSTGSPAGDFPAIEANHIGVRADGSTPGANGYGILAYQAVKIGGSLAQRNVVSANSGAGIFVTTESGSGINIDATTISNNVIGLSADRAQPRGNGSAGISIYRVYGSNQSGGAVMIESNIISANAGAGVATDEEHVESVTIRLNSIYANGGLGIDAGEEGVGTFASPITPAPTVTAIVPGTGGFDQVSGEVKGTANTRLSLDFYRSATVDPSGYGEGHTYVVSIVVDTNAAGKATFTVAVPQVAGQEVVSVTSTNTTGRTSEFSNAILTPPRVGGVSGVMFIDENGNRLRDSNEGYIDGARVYLDVNRDGLHQSDEPISDVDAKSYVFYSLPPGQHQLRVMTPNGYVLTTVNADGAIDRTVTAGNYETLNLGFVAEGALPGTLSVRAFNDLDGSGGPTSDEPAISGRTVYIDLNRNSQLDSGEPSKTTGTDGTATFDPIAPGLYVVRQVLPADWLVTGVTTATNVSPGGSVSVQLGSKYVAPPPPVVTTTLQAEAATMSGGTGKGSSNGGYNGTGYADFGGQNSAAAWAISRTSAGSAKLEFRYANGATTNRPLQVFVNNVLVGTINCEPTGSWTTWKTTSLSSVQLPAGNIVIKAIASTSTGGANLDQLVITAAGSTEEPPPPPPPSDVKFFEAENATMSGGTVKSAGNAGFTGSGFADYAGQGSAVQFNVTRSASGAVTLVFRYANGSTTNRPLQVLVNGNIVGTIACAPTGSWTSWKNVSLANITLPAGTTAIKAIASTSMGGANLDSLTIESGTVVPPPPPPPPPTDSNLTLEAESAQMKNGTGKGTSNSGFTGTGYADYGGQGSAVDFVFNRTAASTVSLQLRYANGATMSRPLQVLVNGNVVGTFACAPTGSWTTWQTATLTNIALPSGAITIRVVASTSVGGGNVDWLKVIAN